MTGSVRCWRYILRGQPHLPGPRLTTQVTWSTTATRPVRAPAGAHPDPRDSGTALTPLVMPEVTNSTPGLDPPAGTPVRGKKAQGRCHDGVWSFHLEVACDLAPEEGQGYVLGLDEKPQLDLALVFLAEPHLEWQLGLPVLGTGCAWWTQFTEVN